MTTDRAIEGEVLWEPSDQRRENSNLTAYMKWLGRTKGLQFSDYQQLWNWSTSDLEAFWGSLWQYFEIKAHRTYDEVLTSHEMPGAEWFPGAEINYTEHVFRMASPDRPALLFKAEDRPLAEISWDELQRTVASLAASFKEMGVGPGDRVAAFMPNIPQTLAAFLACASLGAVWSSCSPDFAVRSVIDRFAQIEPKVLLAVDGYPYAGKKFDCLPMVKELGQKLPGLKHLVLVSYLNPESKLDGAVPWDSLLGRDEPLTYTPVPFNHPMWVVYSSGTTGMPKGLVHSQGGALIELLKFLNFHLDLKPQDRFFWFSTTGWVMWNIVQGGLLTGATPVLFDGNPAWPDMTPLWKLAEQAGFTFFGTSAAFITACMQADLHPGRDYDLSKLHSMGSTGSPLSPEGFRWIYREVKSDLLLGSTSGGTDISSGFLVASPLLPVKSGEMQCRGLGVKAQAWDEDGNSLVNEVGELVITEPMPSMPIYLWNDADGSRYLESYFDTYPGIWRHGDWIKFTPQGGAVILGRSDSTLNRQGVRMGSSDFYRVLDEMPELADSLIVGYTDPGGQYRMPLFVVPKEGVTLDEALAKEIKTRLRTALSPRHVPDGVFAIADVPRTLNGKKLEVPVIRVLAGRDPAKVVNRDSMANPSAMDYFIGFAGNPPW